MRLRPESSRVLAVWKATKSEGLKQKSGPTKASRVMFQVPPVIDGQYEDDGKMLNDNPCNSNGRFLAFGHLGGTSAEGDPDAWFSELWLWLRHKYELRSVFDVGCGSGYTQKFFHDLGLKTLGLDCKQVLEHHVLRTADNFKDLVVAHDLTTGPSITEPHDLVWSCDVAEHIEEEFVGNFAQTIVSAVGRVLAFSAAPEGCGGHHHVHTRNPEYWVELFESCGLRHEPELTERARDLCAEGNRRGPNNYFRRSGLIFLAGE